VALKASNTHKLVVTLICGKLPFQFLLHPGLIDPVVDKWHDFSFWVLDDRGARC
jgi:hypothetical protein